MAKDISFGEFIDLIKNIKSNNVRFSIAGLEANLSGDMLGKYRQLPLTSNLVLGLARFIALLYQKQRYKVGGAYQESYVSFIEEGHLILQKIFEISVQYGIRVDYDKIDVPLTTLEVLKAMGLRD